MIRKVMSLLCKSFKRLFRTCCRCISARSPDCCDKHVLNPRGVKPFVARKYTGAKLFNRHAGFFRGNEVDIALAGHELGLENPCGLALYIVALRLTHTLLLDRKWGQIHNFEVPYPLPFPSGMNAVDSLRSMVKTTCGRLKSMDDGSLDYLPPLSSADISESARKIQSHETGLDLAHLVGVGLAAKAVASGDPNINRSKEDECRNAFSDPAHQTEMSRAYDAAIEWTTKMRNLVGTKPPGFRFRNRRSKSSSSVVASIDPRRLRKPASNPHSEAADNSPGPEITLDVSYGDTFIHDCVPRQSSLPSLLTRCCKRK